MADFERITTVGVGADAAFALFADPLRIPEYVGPMTHVESTAIDGDPDAEPEEEAGGGRGAGLRRSAPPPDAVQASFLADASRRRVEWGLPGASYGGSIEVTPGTPSTSQVTIRLHVRDDAPAAEIDRMLDQTVRTIGRLLSGR
jgi:hypothetical protein